MKENEIFLFHGDSITHGNRGESMDCNHIMGHGYQYILAGRIAAENPDKKPKFINRGVSGWTMEELRNDWQKNVIEIAPDTVSILCGTNDGGTGFNKGTALEDCLSRYKDNFDYCISETLANKEDTKIVVCEPFYFAYPCPHNYANVPHPVKGHNAFNLPSEGDTEESQKYRTEFITKARVIARDAAAEYGCIFVPLYDALNDMMKKTGEQYIMWDGTHPTVAGHWIIAEQWYKTVKP